MGCYHPRGPVWRRTAYSLRLERGYHGYAFEFATQAIYMWAIGLVKISIGLFLLRFAPRRGYKIFIWVVIGESDGHLFSSVILISGSSHAAIYCHLLFCMEALLIQLLHFAFCKIANRI